jgi:hypothetical protein
MCPACISSAAVVVAGAGSTGGILAVCFARFRQKLTASSLAMFGTKFRTNFSTKFRKVFTASGLHLFHKSKEK